MKIPLRAVRAAAQLLAVLTITFAAHPAGAASYTWVGGTGAPPSEEWNDVLA